nr:hypothetical protein CFP56_19129 [Quercus suber]
MSWFDQVEQGGPVVLSGREFDEFFFFNLYQPFIHIYQDPSNLVLIIYFAEISTPRARGHCWPCNAKETVI